MSIEQPPGHSLNKYVQVRAQPQNNKKVFHDNLVVQAFASSDSSAASTILFIHEVYFNVGMA